MSAHADAHLKTTHKRSAAGHPYAAIGKQLADLQIHCEPAAEDPLQRIEAAGEPPNWRVEKMRLTKDKTALLHDDFLSFAGLPEAAFGRVKKGARDDSPGG